MPVSKIRGLFFRTAKCSESKSAADPTPAFADATAALPILNPKRDTESIGAANPSF